MTAFDRKLKSHLHLLRGARNTVCPLLSPVSTHTTAYSNGLGRRSAHVHWAGLAREREGQLTMARASKTPIYGYRAHQKYPYMGSVRITKTHIWVFFMGALSSTDVPVPLLNQPNIGFPRGGKVVCKRVVTVSNNQSDTGVLCSST